MPPADRLRVGALVALMVPAVYAGSLLAGPGGSLWWPPAAVTVALYAVAGTRWPTVALTAAARTAAVVIVFGPQAVTSPLGAVANIVVPGVWALWWRTVVVPAARRSHRWAVTVPVAAAGGWVVAVAVEGVAVTFGVRGPVDALVAAARFGTGDALAVLSLAGPVALIAGDRWPGAGAPRGPVRWWWVPVCALVTVSAVSSGGVGPTWVGVLGALVAVRVCGARPEMVHLVCPVWVAAAATTAATGLPGGEPSQWATTVVAAGVCVLSHWAADGTRRLQAMVDGLVRLTRSAPVPTVITNTGTRTITVANRAAAELVGAGDPAELVGQRPRRWLREPADADILTDRATRPGGLWGRTVDIVRDDGTVRTVVLGMVRMPEVGMSLIQLVDVTGLVEAARAARAAADELRVRQQILGRLVTVVAHDLVGPLSAIAGLIGLADRRPDDPRATEWLHQARLSAERLGTLVRDVVESTRIPDDTPELVGLLGRQIRVHAGMLDAAGVQLRTRIPAGPVRVAVPGAALAGVVASLLSNLARHGAGRPATLGLRVRPDGGVVLWTTNRPGDRSTDRGGGWGIGLAACAEMIGLCGGTVTWGETRGRWRTVVTLPAADAPPSGAARTGAPGPTGHPGD